MAQPPSTRQPRFDENGNRVGEDFLVGAGEESFRQPAVARADDFVVVWEAGTANQDIVGQLFDAQAKPAGHAGLVNTYLNVLSLGQGDLVRAVCDTIKLYTPKSTRSEGRPGRTPGAPGPLLAEMLPRSAIFGRPTRMGVAARRQGEGLRATQDE